MLGKAGKCGWKMINPMTYCGSNIFEKEDYRDEFDEASLERDPNYVAPEGLHRPSKLKPLPRRDEIPSHSATITTAHSPRVTVPSPKAKKVSLSDSIKGSNIRKRPVVSKMEISEPTLVYQSSNLKSESIQKNDTIKNRFETSKRTREIMLCNSLNLGYRSQENNIVKNSLPKSNSTQCEPNMPCIPLSTSIFKQGESSKAVAETQVEKKFENQVEEKVENQVEEKVENHVEEKVENQVEKKVETEVEELDETFDGTVDIDAFHTYTTKYGIDLNSFLQSLSVKHLEIEESKKIYADIKRVSDIHEEAIKKITPKKDKIHDALQTLLEQQKSFNSKQEEFTLDQQKYNKHQQYLNVKLNLLILEGEKQSERFREILHSALSERRQYIQENKYNKNYSVCAKVGVALFIFVQILYRLYEIAHY